MNMNQSSTQLPLRSPSGEWNRLLSRQQLADGSPDGLIALCRPLRASGGKPRGRQRNPWFSAMRSRPKRVQILRASPAECKPAHGNRHAEERFVLLPRAGSSPDSRGAFSKASKGFDSEEDSTRRARGFVLRGRNIGNSSEEILSSVRSDAQEAQSAAATH